MSTGHIDSQQLSIFEQRHAVIIKANALIQNTRFTLPLMEQKILMHVATKISPKDQPYKHYVFNLREFCNVCGIEVNGRAYQEIRDAVDNLGKSAFWIKLDDGSDQLIQWLISANMRENDGRISIQLGEELRPYLQNVKQFYTQLGYESMLCMRSQYSIRIYELLKSYSNMGEIDFIIDDLKDQLECHKYSNYSDLVRRVIEPAVTDIINYSDITVSYEESRTRNKVTRLKFFIREKTLASNVRAEMNRQKFFAGKH